MKSILRLVIGIPVLVASLLLAWIGWNEYRERRYAKPILTAEAKFTEASRRCIIAEASEGAASENDQVIIVNAMLRVAKKRNVDPCWLFTRYTLMRAPSDELLQASIRDTSAVLYKAEWFDAAKSRIALATKVTDRVLAGETSRLESGEPPEVELQRRRMIACAEKYHRVWPFNTARTNIGKMTTEMGASYKSPSHTEFFCPKEESG